MMLGASDSDNRLSKPGHQDRNLQASRPGSSPLTPPRKGFKMLPTGDMSDTDNEEDSQRRDVRAAYAKAIFSHIQPITHEQTGQHQMEIEPKPVMVRAGQVDTLTHRRLIDVVIDSMEKDEHIGMPELVTDDGDQESIDEFPNFEVQDDDIIDFMHNITIMTFSQ
jgi:hypothetical protein